MLGTIKAYPGQVDVGGRAVQAPRVDDAGAAVLPGGRGLDLDGQPVIGLPPPLLHIGPGRWCRLTERNIILDIGNFFAVERKNK